MSKIYMRSKRKDKTCLDTQAGNKIKVLIIMVGIYNEFLSTPTLAKTLKNFKSYYVEKIGKHQESFLFGVSEHHYLNYGAAMLKEISLQKTILTSGRRIKKLCNTYSTRPVCIPKNTSAILNVLFEYVCNDVILKNMFTEIVLNECVYFTTEVKHYPVDCSESILGFVSVFLNNIIEPEFSYSDKYKNKASDILRTMGSIIERFNLKEKCSNRKQILGG